MSATCSASASVSRARADRRRLGRKNPASSTGASTAVEEGRSRALPAGSRGHLPAPLREGSTYR